MEKSPQILKGIHGHFYFEQVVLPERSLIQNESVFMAWSYGCGQRGVCGVIIAD